MNILPFGTTSGNGVALPAPGTAMSSGFAQLLGTALGDGVGAGLQLPLVQKLDVSVQPAPLLPQANGLIASTAGTGIAPGPLAAFQAPNALSQLVATAARLPDSAPAPDLTGMTPTAPVPEAAIAPAPAAIAQPVPAVTPAPADSEIPAPAVAQVPAHAVSPATPALPDADAAAPVPAQVPVATAKPAATKPVPASPVAPQPAAPLATDAPVAEAPVPADTAGAPEMPATATPDEAASDAGTDSAAPAEAQPVPIATETPVATPTPQPVPVQSAATPDAPRTAPAETRTTAQATRKSGPAGRATSIGDAANSVATHAGPAPSRTATGSPVASVASTDSGKGEDMATASHDAAPRFTLPDSGTAPAPAFHAAAQRPAVAATTPLPVAEPQVSARPGALGQGLGVEIARKVEAGESSLRVRMNPAELGRVEVTLSFDDAGSMKATLRADSAHALDLLRQDLPDLARTLDQAGIRTDAQSFRFESRTGDGQSGQSNPQQQRGDDRRQNAAQDESETNPAYRAIRGDGQVDLLA
ncbi:flagellar hook-length control protein FliK [Sphingomonas sp. CJ20]